MLDRAPAATGYAGAEDTPSIEAPRSLVAVSDSESVLDLRIVATPGHTAGHICVLDPVGGIFVAGDALGTAAGVVVGPNARFTADMATAMASIAKLGTLRFEALLVGHGDAIESGAAAMVADLAARS